MKRVQTASGKFRLGCDNNILNFSVFLIISKDEQVLNFQFRMLEIDFSKLTWLQVDTNSGFSQSEFQLPVGLPKLYFINHRKVILNPCYQLFILTLNQYQKENDIKIRKQISYEGTLSLIQ